MCFLTRKKREYDRKKQIITDLYIKNLPPPEERKKYKVSVGGGLFIEVWQSGKYWRYRYKFRGKEYVVAVGIYPQMTLKKAREEHIKLKALLLQGIHPKIEKYKQKYASYSQTATFKELTKAWYDKRYKKWSHGTAHKIWQILNDYAFSVAIARNHSPLPA